MKLQEVRELARLQQIKTGRLSKTDLVREIQKKEGNFACFATAAAGECDQAGCLWREDCFDAAKS